MDIFVHDLPRSSMNTSVATRHPPKSPPLSLSMNTPLLLGESAAPLGTPTPILSSTMDQELPFYQSPKTPKTEVTRTKSQSRRTLGNWQLGKTIGQGSMGRVRLGYSLTTGEQVRTTPLLFYFGRLMIITKR